MLEYQWIKTHKEKKKLLEKLDTENSLWIVSDWQAKSYLEDFYIRSQKNLIGNPFKTSTEFWTERWLCEYPKIPVISEQSIQTFIKSQLHLREEKWCQFPSSSIIVFKLLSHLLPLLSHIEGPELLATLLQNNSSMKKKWGMYLLEALKIWRKIQENFITATWIPSLLPDQSHLALNKKMIIVDMGCELSSTQMFIFQQIAKKNHIIIIAPEISWVSKYSKELKAYHTSNITSESPSQFLNPSHNVESKRFVSMLAEVKDATHTVRKWLEKGIKPHCIAIVAPSLKLYWPALKEYLAFEGIPYNRTSVTGFYSLPEITKWLSQIQVHLKSQVQPHALELAVFRKSHHSISYANFHRIYSTILDPLDYKRSQTIYNQFVKINKKGISKDELIDRHSFLEYILTLWSFESSSQSIEGLTKILKSFVENTQGLPLLKASYWLEILEDIISKATWPLQKANLFGVYISDITSLDHLFVENVYIMGLSEQGLQSKVRSSILTNVDIDLINNQLGFSLESTEKAPLEFYTDRILANPYIHKVITYPESDFMAEILTPSLLWLQNQKEIKLSQEPAMTLWDTYQNKAVHQHLHDHLSSSSWSQDQNTILKNIHNELKPQQSQEITSYTPNILSVSSLERYHKCPFIFYAEDVLKLSSRPALDIDVDPLDKGSLMHALLSHLMQEPFHSEWTDQQLDHLIESLLEKERILFAEDRFKDFFKTTQIKKLKEFLQFEEKWREKFPQTKTILREAKISAYIDPVTGVLSSQEKEKCILIKGRLDRLDQVGDNIFCLIDYKTSLTNKTNYKTWLKKGDFQLGLYALMIQAGCLDSLSGEVVAAVYFGIKEMKRNKGFLLKDYQEKAYFIENSHHKISKEDKEEFFEDIKKEILKIISSIIKGDFQANPRDFKLCDTCHWRNICNAPHLL